MVKYPIIDLKKIADNCNGCYLCNIDGETKEGLENKKIVRKNLESLANPSDQNNNGQLIAEALEICKKCKYEDPNVFYFLERKGFKVA